MRYKKRKGNSLAQYVIIICLVILVLIPLLFMHGKLISEYFENFLLGLKGNEQETTEVAANPSPEPATTPVVGAGGSLGGTPENPVSQCSGGSCDLDFGDYILTGIPEDFNQYIQDHGTSGGSDIISDTFNAIALQLEQQGDIEGSEEYKKLANLGHFIAGVQSTTEQKVSDCMNTSGCMLYSVLQGSADISLPPELATVVPNYEPASNLSFFSADFTRLDKARHYKSVGGSYYEEQRTKNPAYAMVEVYDSIMANPKYSDELKGTTRQLFLDIHKLSFNAEHTIRSIKNVQYGNDMYNIETGASAGTSWPIANETGDAYLQPNTSISTHFDSRLICASGYFKDTGTVCN
jgi:hypothetical protein